jgi:hypothetical protein
MLMKSLALAAAFVVVTGDAAGAQGKGRGKSDEKAGPGPNASVSVSVVFGSADHNVYRDYFVAHPIKAKALPPGIAKNLARGKPLPPGIAKRALPVELVRLVPRPQPGVTIVIVGRDVVAMRDGLVIDILASVVI